MEKGNAGKSRKLFPLDANRPKSDVEINVCDIESANWTRFLIIGFYSLKEDKYQDFTSLKKFLAYVLENYDGQSIFAHFGGKFDFIFLIKQILRDGLYEITDFIPRGAGILSFKMSDGNRSITFRDSSALLPFSLRTLTRNFCVKHTKLEIDYTKIKKVTPRLRKYLEYDCRGLAECLEKFSKWDLIHKAGLAYTVAGQALRVFRLFLKDPLPSLATNIDREIRGAYFGGRTEIFKPVYDSKTVPLNKYDVNSLYPTVMSECKNFPGAFLYETKYFSSKDLGFYRCRVMVPEMQIPPLGILHNGKYVFPTGVFDGMFSSIELNYARTLGVKIEKVYAGFIFEGVGPIFRDFVSELYAIRSNPKSSETDRFICKLLLNSCYGRMGLRLDREQIVFHSGEGLKPLREIRVGKKNYRLSTKEVQIESFSNVAIAAWVTSLARIHMHKNYFQKYPDKIYYTDTDSLHFLGVLKTGKGLGKLKHEGDNWDPETKRFSSCYLLPKTYKAGKTVVMKGFDGKKIKDFTWDDFMECLRGDLTRLKIIQEPKFATFKTGLRQGMLTMTKKGTRQIQSKYDKRIIIKKGEKYDTRPIRLE